MPHSASPSSADAAPASPGARGATRARRERIVTMVQSGETAVESLSAVLAVSPSTIRRDLAELRRGGRITRTYGGALLTGHGYESTVDERDGQAWEQKHAIARRALELVADGDTVFLDGGTTVGQLVPGLTSFRNLTVITNSLTELPTLMQAPFTVIFLGGELRRPSQSTVGPLSEEALRRLSADHAFLGADGIVAGRGICEADLTQTIIKETMSRNALRTHVLADSSKLGSAPFTAWAVLSGGYTLITDDGATAEQLRPFEQDAGAEVVVVPAAPAKRPSGPSV